jgi:ribosomal protein S18 acetylase RimI-like enzyme
VNAALEVRPCTESDARQLFVLARAAFADLPGWSERRVLQILRDDLVFVARENGRAAGYVALRRNDDDSFVVEQLFVAQGHERRGVGRRLLAYAEGYAIAQRAAALLIIVEEDNRVAQSFYRRSGFVPVAEELFELVLPRLG